MLKLTEQAEFEEYLREHPNAFSWKTVAEVLYRCGEGKQLDTLFTYMKSPEGNSVCVQYRSTNNAYRQPKNLPYE